MHDEEGFYASLVVQLIRLKTLRRGLATVRAVTGLNGAVVGRSSKLELGLAWFKSRWGQAARGHESVGAGTWN